MRMWMNSKFVEEGDCFLVSEKNKKYVSDSIKKGSKKIITETENIFDIETIKVDNINVYLYNNYKEYIDKLRFIGITGTNGKTTTCFLIYQMLKMMDIKACYIGTIGFYINDEIYSLDNTTPSIDFLYNLIKYAYEKDIDVVVMEVSSHALKQDRIYGILFDAIGVTNVTKEHLDYHKTMKDYVLTKKKLISLTKNKKICILNNYDKYYKKFINENNNNFIIGKDLKIKKVKESVSCTELIFKDNKKIKTKLNLVGRFNILNFLMAYKIIKELGYDNNYILDNARYLGEPKGRMQKINYNKNTIFIDYAHTPDAVQNVLKTVKKIQNKGIITVIGCGGDRDKYKRPVMAKIACKYSKYVIFTNDNPRYEDEKEIVNDMLKGAKGKYEVIYDRYSAIEKGVSLLKENNILMILGKGHEEYQIIKDKKIYFSDYESVLEIIDNK